MCGVGESRGTVVKHTRFDKSLFVKLTRVYVLSNTVNQLNRQIMLLNFQLWNIHVCPN